MARATHFSPIVGFLILIFLFIMSASFGRVGDINDDGIVNYVDTLMVTDHILGRAALSDDALTSGDANADGRIDVQDVISSVNKYSSTYETITLPRGVPLILVKIPSGSYMMGRSVGEVGSESYEDPQHFVIINYDFYMCKYEITQNQWLAVMGSWPHASSQPTIDYGLGDNFPAYYVSWDDVKNYITKVNDYITFSEQGPLKLRLPSEAEWEYACRAGSHTRFFFGDSGGLWDGCLDAPAGLLPGNRNDYMWYCANDGGATTSPDYRSKEVGTKHGNQFGLHDMSGNVAEWCEDDFHTNYINAPDDGNAWGDGTGTYRVVRGGRWLSPANKCRSASRAYHPPIDYTYHTGFRLVAIPSNQ